MTQFPVGTSPTLGFIDAQRYGSLLVVAQFVIYEKGVLPVYYVPNDQAGHARGQTERIVRQILEQYPVQQDQLEGESESGRGTNFSREMPGKVYHTPPRSDRLD